MSDNIHIMVATPMYGGLAHQRFMESNLMLLSHCRHENINISFSFLGNESLITRARNSLVHEFMKGTCTHLLFVDADIGFNSFDVMRMIKADKEIIAGVYPKKDINWPAVGNAARSGVNDMSLKDYSGDFVINIDAMNAGEIRVPTNDPYPVANAGTGLMLIKRSVFEKLAGHVPVYMNNMSNQNEGLLHTDMIGEYFATSIDPKHNVLLSEDYHFCQLWKRHGGEVFIAPWADLTHSGTYTFSGRMNRREE